MVRKDIQECATRFLSELRASGEYTREELCRILTECSRQLGKLGIKRAPREQHHDS